MTNTEFIVRSKSGAHPLFKAGEIEFRLVDGLMVIGFLAVFVGLVFILAK